MVRIAGASQFLNQSTLVNKQTASGQQSSAFDPGNILALSVSDSLLDVGRNNRVSGIGLSSRARALNQQLLESNSGAFNQLFSLTGGVSATVESAQVQIAGLASTVSSSREVARDENGNIIGSTIDFDALDAALEAADDGGITEGSLGNELDESV